MGNESIKEFDDRLVYEITNRPGLCHCSSIEETLGGGLLAVWYEGSYEGAPGTAIRASRLPADGDAWTEPRDIIRYPDVPLGNPVLFRLPGNKDGVIQMLFSLLLGESWTEGLLFLTRSVDGGQSWSNPELLSPKKGLMGKTKPVMLPGGRIIFPLYDEAGYYPVVLVAEGTDDWPAARLTAETMSRDIAIQPAIVRRPDGSLLMFCRSSKGVIWRSVSENDGLSWSIGEATKIPNPDAAVDLLDLGGGAMALAYNPSATDRHCLDLAYSPDAGASWTCGLTMIRGNGEYSYPSLTLGSDGTIHLTYTESRYRIRHAALCRATLESARLEKPFATG